MGILFSQECTVQSLDGHHVEFGYLFCAYKTLYIAAYQILNAINGSPRFVLTICFAPILPILNELLI